MNINSDLRLGVSLGSSNGVAALADIEPLVLLHDIGDDQLRVVVSDVMTTNRQVA